VIMLKEVRVEGARGDEEATAFAPPVFPRDISVSQSSTSLSDSASDWVVRASPSGRSKSVSAHSSRGRMRDGAGTGVIVLRRVVMDD
jgi:hypothetical protein